MKTTRDLQPGDIMVLPDGEFRVLEYPHPGVLGRLNFSAKDLGTNQVLTHAAQPDMEWEIRRDDPARPLVEGESPTERWAELLAHHVEQGKEQA